MMPLGMLVEGKWVDQWRERDQGGRFHRIPTTFRAAVSADSASPHPAAAGRYHLYVSLGCPWAHRTVLMWKLKGLEDVISLSIVDPASQGIWTFSDAPGCIPDTVNGAKDLSEVYLKAEPAYTGKVTVPVLWDKETGKIVNNESRQIIRMLDHQFNSFAAHPERDFCPSALEEAVEETIEAIYEPINNGVYRSGFASTQEAYEEAVTELFRALDHWEKVLSGRRYLCGKMVTEADWCMFPTLFRFDLAYHGVFKCNLRRLIDYPNLWGYFRDLYSLPGVREVCSAEHVKQVYYRGMPEVNPSGVVPLGPVISYDEPPARERL